MEIKTILSSFLGGLLEFFEFTVFGFLASILIPLFLIDGHQSITSFFLVFAVGFIARPFGGLLFGYIGDRFGRKSALISSLFLMAVVTFAIGCLPTIKEIGVTATILLISLRLLQGISAGGEFTGGVLFAVEKSSSKYPAFIASLVGTGAMLGILLGNVVSKIVINSSNPELYWRVPFLASILISGICFFIRNKISESEEFIKSEKTIRAPVSYLFKEGKSNFTTAVLIAAIGGVLCYFNTFYISSISGFKNYSILANFFLVVLPPLSAFISDKYIGTKKTLIVGGILSMFFLPIFLLTLPLLTISLKYTLHMCLIFSAATFLGPMHAIVLNLFETKVRYTGYSFSYSIGMGVLGGSVPFLISFFYDLTNSNILFSSFFVALCGGAIIGLLKKTKSEDGLYAYS